MSEFATRLDLWIVVGYLLAMLVVAAWVSQGSRDVEGYTVGNRQMDGWVVGFSVLGTFTSSITFLGLPAQAFSSNWNAYCFGLALPVAAWVAVTWFIPLYRDGVRLSAYEFLEQRFGYWARAYAAAAYLVLQSIRVATVLLLVALAVSPMLGWGIVETIALAGLVVIIYDVMGGIQAVIWTDVWQVLILFAGALWCLAAMLWRLPAGPASLFHAVPAHKFSLGLPASTDLSQATMLVVFVYGLSENVRNYGTDQAYVQRMLTARSRADAARSFWFAALSYVPLSIVFFLIGTTLYAHQQVNSGLLPPGLRADQVFPFFIQHELHPAVSGLVVAAILAAAMSTVDSCLNSMSTVWLVDVVRPFRRGEPRLPEIVTLRLSTAWFGLLGSATAAGLYLQYAEQSRTVMDLWWQYAGTAGGGLFGLFLLAWLAPQLPSWGALAAILSTLPVLAWGTFARQIPPDSAWYGWRCPLHPFLVGVSATSAMLCVALLVCLAVRWGWVARNERTALLPHELPVKN